jgi:hypothetical protein
MRIYGWLSSFAIAVIGFAVPGIAYAAHEATRVSAGRTGISAIWLLANISYAAMRAQNSPNTAWRVVAFIFGFPGTLITFLAVPEGGERAYGIELPKGTKPGA